MKTAMQKLLEEVILERKKSISVEFREALDFVINAIKTDYIEPPKQETTLEESKNGTIIQFLSGSHSYDGVWFGEKHPFREGAFWWRTILNKWQQERSYSEEEVLQLLIKFYQFNNFNGTIEEWLEQLKNQIK